MKGPHCGVQGWPRGTTHQTSCIFSGVRVLVTGKGEAGERPSGEHCSPSPTLGLQATSPEHHRQVSETTGTSWAKRKQGGAHEHTEPAHRRGLPALALYRSSHQQPEFLKDAGGKRDSWGRTVPAHPVYPEGRQCGCMGVHPGHHDEPAHMQHSKGDRGGQPR